LRGSSRTRGLDAPKSGPWSLGFLQNPLPLAEILLIVATMNSKAISLTAPNAALALGVFMPLALGLLLLLTRF
jgi:hypothetical protein